MIARRLLVGASALTIVAMTAGVAQAALSAKSSTGAVGTAKALAIPLTTGVAAADGTGQSVITWNAVSFGPGVTGYRVQRYTAAAPATTGQTAVCAAALTSTAVTCTDTGVAAGSYFYSVTALYKPSSDATVNWSGPESSRDAATISASTTLVITGLGSQTSGNIKPTFKGTGASSGGAITIRVCTTNATCTSANQVTSATATGNADGTWTSGFTAGNITSGATYYATAVQATPARTSATVSFQAP